MLNGKQVNLNVKIGEPFIEKSYYSPEFGKKLSSQCLTVSLDKRQGSSAQILWES